MEFKETLLTKDELGIIYQCISREVRKQAQVLNTEPMDSFNAEELWQIRTHLSKSTQMIIFSDYFKSYLKEEIGILERLQENAGIESGAYLMRFIRDMSNLYAERLVYLQTSEVKNPEI